MSSAGGRKGFPEERARGDGGVLGDVRPAPLAAANLQARVEPRRRAHSGASARKGGEVDLTGDPFIFASLGPLHNLPALRYRGGH